jgi:alkaline phosphatase
MDNGVGNIPGVEYSSGGHTNQLVPLFAKGKGANAFSGLVDMQDPNAQSYWELPNANVVDNTDVFTVMEGTIPEPATMSLLALGGLGALIRRRK